MRILNPEPGKNRFPMIGSAISVRIVHPENVRSLPDQSAAQSGAVQRDIPVIVGKRPGQQRNGLTRERFDRHQGEEEIARGLVMECLYLDAQILQLKLNRKKAVP